MFCPKCGKELDSNNVCSNPACPSHIDNSNHTNQNLGVNNDNIEVNNGTPNQYNNQTNNSNYGYNQNYANPQNFNNFQSNTDNNFKDRNGISPSEMMTFIGEKNSHYYLEQWQKSQENENFISWNWPAFFINYLWFWHRKMYGLAGIIFGIRAFLNIIGLIIIVSISNSGLYSATSHYYTTRSSSSPVSWILYLFALIISIVCSLFANQLYIKHATKKIKTIKASSSMGFDNNAIFNRLRSTGGTTWAPLIFEIVWVVLVILLVIFIVVIAVNSASSRYSSFY